MSEGEKEKIVLVIPKGLADRFRDKVHKKYKSKQGSMSKCGIEAIELWLGQNSE